MTSRDSQTRIVTLANSLRRELDVTIEQLINCARSLAPPDSGEALLHLEWFARFCLETQLTPSLLATASAIRELESTEQPDPSNSEAQTIEILRALVARIQTRPLLEMDSEFELYMFDKYKSMLAGAEASPSGELSREYLATRRFDEKISNLNTTDS